MTHRETPSRQACPGCAQHRVRCLETRKLGARATRRRYVCDGCDGRYKSTEIPEGDPDWVVFPRARLERLLRVLATASDGVADALAEAQDSEEKKT